jgi:hypothetical protein
VFHRDAGAVEPTVARCTRSQLSLDHEVYRGREQEYDEHQPKEPPQALMGMARCRYSDKDHRSYTAEWDSEAVRVDYLKFCCWVRLRIPPGGAVQKVTEPVSQSMSPWKLTCPPCTQSSPRTLVATI